MKLKFTILLLLVSFFLQAQRNGLSDQAEISVLTIGPGKLLNDSFGHSGFRVKDRTLGIDSIYNYGTFDFEDPNFYLKFAQGKLNYRLSVNEYDDFFRYYMAQNRSVDEQILNLTHEQKQAVFAFLNFICC